MNTSQGALAVLCALLALLSMLQLCSGQKSELQCEHQYCRATGTVGMDNETYPYTVASGAGYQLVITLRSTKGDVDLSVAPPHRGSVKTSSAKARNSRKDVVTFSQKELQGDPGVYSITVVSSASVESDYTLDIQQASVSGTAQQLHKDDAAALEKVFEQCCEDDGSCPTLRKLVEDKDTGLCEAAPNRCDEDGHLTHLSLSSEGLECKFPKAVSKLKTLTRLDFTFNQLDGSVEEDVAPALESLGSLEHLSLGFNELEGELTCGLLGPEKKLHELDLAHNEIEGSIPECLLSSSALQELYLANNALSGSLPRMLEDVPLTTLSVADQKGKGLSGELPSFTHAQGLSVLRLNGNSFTGQLPELPSTVQEIRVQGNELHGSIPRGYGFLKQLHTFKAEENKLSGSIPSGLAGLQALQILDLSLNRLTGAIPSPWEAPKLVEMDLHSNSLSGGIPGSLALLPRLSYLQLQDNELTGDLSAYAADLSGLELPSATRFFSVGGNQLTGVISEEFQKLGAFLPGAWNILDGLLFQKTLNLSQNAFSGELPTWALHSMSADEGLTVQLAGNKWTCPHVDSISVCSNLDEVQLGKLKCVDEAGLADSATSRYSVIDLLRIMPASVDCPEQELAEGVADFKVSEHGQLLPGFKVHFTPTQEGMALEDFNGKEIWDAAWGEADYTYDDEEDGDDEESAPWGLTNKRIEGFPELPGEEELKEREEKMEEPRGDVDLPNWSTGQKVKSSEETQEGSRPGSDVDLPDWAPGHKVPSRYSGSHPGQAEREESYHWAQDASRAQDAETPPDARHDTSARKQDDSTDASITAEQRHGDGNRRDSPAPSISLHLPGVSAAVKAATGSKQGSGTDGDRTATMLLAAFAVVLGVCAVLGGLAVWKVYQQRQRGAQYEGLAMEAGMAGLELQKSSSGLGEDHEGDTLLAKKSPVINLHATAGGDVPADVAAYKPPPAL